MQHILSARQFEEDQLSEIFAHADEMRQQMADNRRELAQTHAGRVVATLFYESSTRTRVSHETAALRLGASVVGTENADEFSSAIKGETLEDTIRTIGAYADLIVLRHKENGAADRAAQVSEKPIINAGDGSGEHPTQALLDLYTIFREKKRLGGLNVVIGGDLKHGRTARSLALLLSLYSDNKISFVSTSELQIGEDIKTHLTQKGVAHEEVDDVYEPIHTADVVYWTRLQKERMQNPAIGTSFTIDQSVLQAMRSDAIIMHPLPRVDEIAPSVDADPRAVYLPQQVENGMFIRMALIDQLLS